MWSIFTQAATLLVLIMTDCIFLQQGQYEVGSLGHFRFGSVLRSKPMFRRGVLINCTGTAGCTAPQPVVPGCLAR
jgi:hypothetical protein